MIELIETGDVPAARKIHESLSPLYNALFITSNPIPLKAALEMVGRPGGRPAPAGPGHTRSARRSAGRWRTPASSDTAPVRARLPGRRR